MYILIEIELKKEGAWVCGIFVDLKTAFDMVNRNQLCDYMKREINEKQYIALVLEIGKQKGKYRN